jgi:hypothetical protein
MGTKGIIVVCHDGDAYEIEFTAPIEKVVGVIGQDLEST